MTDNRQQVGDQDSGHTKIRLKLFVAGKEPNSAKTRQVVTEVCRKYLAGRCELIVIDVLRDYKQAIDNNIMAVPTLIIESPVLRRVIVGSINQVEKLMETLDPDNLDASL